MDRRDGPWTAVSRRKRSLKTPFSFMIANEYDTKADFLQIENANYLTRPELGQCENDYGFDDI